MFISNQDQVKFMSTLVTETIMVLEEEEDTTMTMSEFSRMIGAGAGERRCPCNFSLRRRAGLKVLVFSKVFLIL